MGCGASSAAERPLPQAPSTSEYAEFVRLAAEPVEGAGSKWAVKVPWSAAYRPEGFNMRVALRPHECGNPNLLLRADGRFTGGVTPDQFVDFLLNPVTFPGLQEIREVERLPDGVIKYLRVKAPGFAPRDHVWRYTIDERVDGSIFVCVRTTAHADYPVTPGVYRAFYYNATLLRTGKDEAGQSVCELTEFVFQDLGGGIPPWLMNAALPAGTINVNIDELKYFKSKKASK